MDFRYDLIVASKLMLAFFKPGDRDWLTASMTKIKATWIRNSLKLICDREIKVMRKYSEEEDSFTNATSMLSRYWMSRCHRHGPHTIVSGPHDGLCMKGASR
eukprot:1209176-Pyramimonas_sp.AAC.1